MGINELRLRATEIRGKVTSGEGINAEELEVLRQYAARTTNPQDILAYSSAKGAIKADNNDEDNKDSKNDNNDNGDNIQDNIEKDIVKQKMDEKKAKEKAAYIFKLKNDMAEAADRAQRSGLYNDQLKYIEIKQKLNEATGGE